MRSLHLVAFALALFALSCGKAPDAGRSGNAASSPPPAAEDSGEGDGLESVVRLTPEALAKARLVWEAATSHSIPQTLRASGRITIDESRVWRVGAVSDGLLVEMNAHVDDTVRQGQVIARLRSRAVNDGRADYAEAKNTLATLETRRAFLLTQAARTKRLLDLKAASEQQLQQAESDVRDVEGQIANAKAELERQRIHLEEFLHVQPQPAGAAGRNTAGYRTEDLVPIASPVSGTVIERPASLGTIVPMAQTVYVISDLSNLWMIAEVQQQHLASLREGMAVAIRTQAFPEETFPARIARIGSELNPVTRTISVRIEVRNRGLRLRPEMYADAEIAMGGTETGIFVKQEAIQDLNGQSVVFVKTGDGTFTLRNVETGVARDGMRLIVSGVREGEQVVVAGGFLLKSKLLEASLTE